MTTSTRQHVAAVRPAEADVAADTSTEDRVHAWYKARKEPGQGGADTTARATPDESTPAATPKVLKRTATPQPDLALTAHTATAADFERASQKQREIIRAAASAKSAHTTADDDAAFAEASNIPSTAPTERVPAPFLHGDLQGTASHAPNAPRPATLTGKADTPTIAHVDTRGDAEVLSGSLHSKAVDTSLRPGELMPMPTPKVAPILRSPAPAVASVTAAASKPVLDPSTGDNIAVDALNGNAPSLPASDLPGAQPTRPLIAGRGIDAGYEVDLAGGSTVKVNLFDTAGKLILLPAMKGSHEILVHQNQMAIADGLDRVEDDSQLQDMRRLKLLVALPDNDSMFPDGRLPGNRRFARPWTVRFLNDLSQAHFARFHTPLIVTSAVRTVAFQRRLVLTNGNAAPPTGEVASPHLYGQAVDIAKHGMSMTEIAWMRSYLTPVESAGKIDVEEEFQQACFHLSVYRRYLGLPGPRNTPAPEVAPSRVLQQVRTVQPAVRMHPLQRARAVLARRRHLPTALLATGLR